jgi:isochorismate synthase
MNSTAEPSDSRALLPDPKMAFVLFKLPGENKPELWVQSNSHVETISTLSKLQDTSGFLFAPFIPSTNNPVLILQPDYILEVGDALHGLLKKKPPKSTLKNADVILSQTDKQLYLKNLERIIQRLKSSAAEKVVFSRTTVTKSLSNRQLFQLHNALCKDYPDAFVYFAHLPPYGRWMGVSPESLISCQGNTCQTMALAGTRLTGSQAEWGDKEKEEQAIVSRFIHDNLVMQQVEKLEVSMPFTKKAGQIEHLCTTFNFELTEQSPLIALAAELHPTPAVCGFPKDDAMQLISHFETHDREYYTGFLGPVNRNGETDLFVNLRCMKITPSNTILFAGGGITKDSVPEKEWEETELKTQTLLSVIKKIRG